METGRATSKRVRTVLSSNEEAVRESKVKDTLTFLRSEVSTVTKALETLSRFADKGIVK
jgi:hypothetical protein